MARLIDADELKKAVEDFPNCYNGWSDAYDKAFIIGAIEEAPTIDAVSVVRGEWIDKMNYRDGSYYSICSECGYFDDERDDLTAYNFCPYCGAKMKGADDE